MPSSGRAIGSHTVSPIAMGCAGLSLADVLNRLAGADPDYLADEASAIRTVHAALDAGVDFLDSARAYTTPDQLSHNEVVLRRALASHPAGPRTLVATKGGHYRAGDDWKTDARPDTIRRHCEQSLEFLGVGRLALYQLHFPDPAVPMETAMATFAELRDEGLIGDVGISNVSVAQIEAARSVVPIVSVQNGFSPFEGDRDVLDYCTEHGIALLAYMPLGGFPRPGSVGANQLSDAFPAAAAVAARKQVSIQRLALAWLLTLSPILIPVCGARRPETIADSFAAVDTLLTQDELAELDFGGVN